MKKHTDKYVLFTPEYQAAQLAGSMRLEGFMISKQDEQQMIDTLTGKIDGESELDRIVEQCKQSSSKE